MAGINFDNLHSNDDWSAALGTLLDDAKAAIEQKDQDKKAAVQDSLTTFVSKAPIRLKSMAEIASKAVHNLSINITQQALDEIVARNKELKAAIEILEDTTEKNKKATKAIMLEDVRKALDQANATVTALKKLEESLTDKDASLINKLESVGKTIGELQKTFKSEG